MTPVARLLPTVKTQAGLDMAITLAGSQAKLARLLNKPRQTVNEWVRLGWIPHQHLDEIVSALPKLSKAELRPDIFEDDMPAIERIVFIAGGISVLSDKLGIKYATVRAWAYGEARVPPRFVKRLCKISGNVVKPHQLRPDVFATSADEF